MCKYDIATEPNWRNRLNWQFIVRPRRTIDGWQQYSVNWWSFIKCRHGRPVQTLVEQWMPINRFWCSATIKIEPKRKTRNGYNNNHNRHCYTDNFRFGGFVVFFSVRLDSSCFLIDAHMCSESESVLRLYGYVIDEFEIYSVFIENGMKWNGIKQRMSGTENENENGKCMVRVGANDFGHPEKIRDRNPKWPIRNSKW